MRAGEQRRAVVVVGASRSGTSTVARGLQVLGVELGDRLRRASWRNPRGFYEDEELLALSRRLRGALGLGPKSVALVPPEAYRRREVRELQRRALALLRRRIARYRPWGFKDGRTLRMFPFWEEVFAALKADVRFVVALRNPLSVARSRMRIQERKLLAPRLDAERAELLWLVSVVPHFRAVAGRPFVVVDYDRMLAAPEAELRRLAAALDLPLDPSRRAAVEAYAAEFLAPALRHSRYAPEDVERQARFPALTAPAYGWLRALATDQASPDDDELWRQWRRLETGLGDMAPWLQAADRAAWRRHRLRWRLGGALRRLAP